MLAIALIFWIIVAVVILIWIGNHLLWYFEKRNKTKRKKDWNCRINCCYISPDYLIHREGLKCAVNPTGDCHKCKDYRKE
jgi:hypothetical protein